MPTDLAPAAPRRRGYGIARMLLMMAVLMIGRVLFVAAIWCLEFGDDYARTH